MKEKSGKSGNGYPRVGVYICDCGTNIAATVDFKALVDDAAGLPGVSQVENKLTVTALN